MESPKPLKLSILIPVYNEKKTILELLNKVDSVDLGNVSKEIILVDDYSTDGTREILNSIKNKYKIIFHEKNIGKGGAIRTAIKNATGDVAIIQDADLEYDPEEYKKMLPLILNHGYQVVYGSRYNSEFGHLKEHNHMTFNIHKVGNRFLSSFTSALYFKKITDMETCYKMFTKDVYKNLNLVSDRFDIEPEITSKILKGGYKFKEVPIRYYSRDFDEGKKITWRDGVVAVFSLLKWRFKK